eukprot:2576917-Prymnesium_polylepis.1
MALGASLDWPDLVVDPPPAVHDESPRSALARVARALLGGTTPTPVPPPSYSPVPPPAGADVWPDAPPSAEHAPAAADDVWPELGLQPSQPLPLRLPPRLPRGCKQALPPPTALPAPAMLATWPEMAGAPW